MSQLKKNPNQLSPNQIISTLPPTIDSKDASLNNDSQDVLSKVIAPTIQRDRMEDSKNNNESDSITKRMNFQKKLSGQADKQADKELPQTSAINLPKAQPNGGKVQVEVLPKAPAEISKKRMLKIMLHRFFTAKAFNHFMVFMTAFYTILMFGQFSLDDPSQTNQIITNILSILQYLEIGIIVIFIAEIALKCYCYGSLGYFKQRMQKVDAAVIFISLFLVVFSYFITYKAIQLVSKLLRISFRFLRLFMILRKVKSINSDQLMLEKYGDQTPVEKILSILDQLRTIVLQTHYQKELEWAQQMISSNKLYEPILDKEENELAMWMRQYNGDQHNSSKTKQSKPIENNQSNERSASQSNGNQNNSQQKQQQDQQQSKQIAIPKEQNNKISVSPREENKTTNISLSKDDFLSGRRENRFVYEPIEMSQKAQTKLESCTNREFNVFEFFSSGFNNELAMLLNYLFEKYDCFSAWKLQPQILYAFSSAISEKYNQNLPYHNVMHAFDVTQTMLFFLNSCQFINLAQLNSIDIGTAFLACAIHDVEHPGFNNPYQVNARTSLAVLYNDKSPLENHHLSVTFKLIRHNNTFNIFSGLDKKITVEIRQLLIQMILKTDMAEHFSSLAQLKGRLASNEFDAGGVDKQLSLMTLLHAADVSNPFKPFHIYQQWTQRVLEEFWMQGDSERNMGVPISYLCDRYTTNLAKSQVGFIDFIVKPFYTTICQFLPDLSHYMSVFNTNKQEWQVYEEYYEKQLAQLGVNQKQKNITEDSKVNIP